MCNKKCDPKWLWCVGAIGVIIIILLSIVVHFSAGASNKVEMVGPDEKAAFKESSGIHLLEIEEPEGKSSNWTLLEIGFVVLCFKFVLVMTHVLHYCFITKGLVGKKVTKNMEVEMLRLSKNTSPTGGIEVPALV